MNLVGIITGVLGMIVGGLFIGTTFRKQSEDIMKLDIRVLSIVMILNYLAIMLRGFEVIK